MEYIGKLFNGEFLQIKMVKLITFIFIDIDLLSLAKANGINK